MVNLLSNIRRLTIAVVNFSAVAASVLALSRSVFFLQNVALAEVLSDT